MLGSCKSFFDPCGPAHGSGRFGHHGRGNSCPYHPLAMPYGRGYNTCCYDSYLNN
jgi:hypothetical protein